MNLFRLSDNPIEAAIFNQDLHARKILLEAGSLLCNAYPESKLLDAPKTKLGNIRKHSWFNHPISQWTRENINNFKWVLSHAVALSGECEYRFGKQYFGQKLIEWCQNNVPELPDKLQTIQPQCFGDFINKCYVKGNPVQGYIRYYNEAKLSFNFGRRIVKATWTKREIPYFIDKKKLDKN